MSWLFRNYFILLPHHATTAIADNSDSAAPACLG